MYSTAHDAQVFLVHILSQLEHRIALLLPKEERQKAVKFMAYAQAVSDEFRTYMMRYGLQLCSPAGRQLMMMMCLSLCPAFSNIATLFVKMEPVLTLLAAVKWDVATMPTRHNGYIDKLIQNLQESDKILKSKAALTLIAHACTSHSSAASVLPLLGVGGLPEHLTQALWREVIYYVLDSLLDGYSKVKKV